jgi:4-diphosphocytidyl-2-C-methyl-D-erythritol kinase
LSNLILKSPAKLNLYLKITNKYPNGFHELDTAFQLIDLCDVLEFDSSATNVSISCNDNSIKEHENIVYKVVMAMKERDKKK